MIPGIARFSFIYADAWMGIRWILLCSCGVGACLCLVF